MSAPQPPTVAPAPGPSPRPGISYVAATWTVPLVLGLVVLLVAAGSRTEAQSRVLTVSVLVVLAVVGLAAVLLSRARIQRGVGLGLVAGALVSAVLLVGTVA